MKEIEEILSNINEAIEAYETMPLEDYHSLSEVLRTLSSNLFFLEKHRDEAKQQWLDIYFSRQGSNAMREKIADREVPEIYTYRRLMTSGYKITDAIRSQISIYKKERN